MKVPRDLHGDQVQLYRSIKGKNPGVWLVWTARGPFLVGRANGVLWSVFPDVILKDAFSEGFEKAKAWWSWSGLEDARFKTRREAVSALRAALAMSS